ncbi:MAG TPA: nuclear transport factor 2 family protein [Mucilaginibacter sp.]|nr:nuclear transport factor 2 family protein [Mucilaginibacter sp.]
MKIACYAALLLLTASVCMAQSKGDRLSLARTTKAIRDAFARGDVDAIVALHHPDVIKYFGGKNVVKGRDELRKGLVATFRNVKMEFVGNTVESTVFNGSTAIETSIFTFKVIPKSGGKATFSKGRSMVVYVKYKPSPTGWASIREMAQAAP